MRRLLILCVLFLFSPAYAFGFEQYLPVEPTTFTRQVDDFDFTVITKGVDTGLKILVVGGIQGDEPGGFSAASLLSTHYVFHNAQVTIVPNLNFESIIKRSRGSSGDMNRKFADLSKKDPQYEEVVRLQNLILELEPDIILNLHDGSGFYSPTKVSSNRNPDRWGQALIIDQEKVPCALGNLEEIAKNVVDLTNKKIPNKDNQFHVRNTHTDQGNSDMEKTLTWFAVRHDMSAFGLEVSKEFNVPQRTFYHLIQLESFFEVLNVDFEKSFSLDVESIQLALSSNVFIDLADGRVIIPLQNLRAQQAGYFPLPKPVQSSSLQPIVALVNNKNNISVHYGNNTLSNFKTQAYDLTSESPTLQITIDGAKQEVAMGDIIHVTSTFKVDHQNNLRINAIGAKKEIRIGNMSTEANVSLGKKDFDSAYSLDKSSQLYRVEVYQADKFAGMFLVDFSLTPTYVLTLPSSVNADPDSLTGR